MLNLSEPGQISKYEMSLYIYVTPLLAHLFKDIHSYHTVSVRKSDRLVWRREKSSYNCFDTFICKHSVMMYRFLGNSVKMLLRQLCYLNLSCRVHANKDIKTIARFVKPLFSSKKLWLYFNQSVLPTNGNYGLLHVNEKDCIKMWKECSIPGIKHCCIFMSIGYFLRNVS